MNNKFLQDSKKIIIAIDGYSGCGKSTTAKKVASELEYIYIDSGAMYRAVTLFFLNNKVNINDMDHINTSLKRTEIFFKWDALRKKNVIFLNDENVDERIREMDVSNYVSEVSTLKIVREKMVSIQQKMGILKGIVMDGRDIGTVVFPDAELKIFMTADIHIRAARRQKEYLEKGQNISIEDVIENLEKRDTLDKTRKESPLKKPENASILDTSKLLFEEQIDFIIKLAKEKMN